MKTLSFNDTPDSIYCPATGQRIVGPFDGNVEGHGSWDDPACSSHLHFMWDNISGEFTHCSQTAADRFDQALEEIETETGEVDEQEAFTRMIEKWETEDDQVLNMVFGNDGGLHVAFDLSTPVHL